jgi:hypothetical protein
VLQNEPVLPESQPFKIQPHSGGYRREGLHLKGGVQHGIARYGGRGSGGKNLEHPQRKWIGLSERQSFHLCEWRRDVVFDFMDYVQC